MANLTETTDYLWSYAKYAVKRDHKVEAYRQYLGEMVDIINRKRVRGVEPFAQPACPIDLRVFCMLAQRRHVEDVTERICAPTRPHYVVLVPETRNKMAGYDHCRVPAAYEFTRLKRYSQEKGIQWYLTYSGDYFIDLVGQFGERGQITHRMRNCLSLPDGAMADNGPNEEAKRAGAVWDREAHMYILPAGTSGAAWWANTVPRAVRQGSVFMGINDDWLINNRPWKSVYTFPERKVASVKREKEGVRDGNHGADDGVEGVRPEE